jgi:hypothetical protein
MRALAVLCFGGCLVSLVGCKKGFGSDFEGTIVLHTTKANGTVNDLTVKTKGDKLRFETALPTGATAVALYSAAGNQLTLVMDAQKTAMDLDLSPVDGGPAPNVDAASSSASETGKSEKIAGYSCDDWVVKDPSGKRSEVCIAKGLAYFDLDSLRNGSAGTSWSNKMRTEKMFPLRTVDYDAGGKEISRTEATSITPGKLDVSIFDVPAGYARVPSRAVMGKPQH